MIKTSNKGSYALSILASKLIILALPFGMPSLSHATTVSTSFEGLPGGDFTIGTSPITATFTNGDALTVGVSVNYLTGTYSWHVHAQEPAVISFETPASNVSLWIRNPEGTGPSTVRVIDVNDNVVSTTSGTSSFQLVEVSRTTGQSLIDRVEIRNSSTDGRAYGGGGEGGGGDVGALAFLFSRAGDLL